jgi:hypothetical protein
MPLLGDGLPVVLAECRACCHRETWDGESLDATGDGNW